MIKGCAQDVKVKLKPACENTIGMPWFTLPAYVDWGRKATSLDVCEKCLEDVWRVHE